MNFKTPIKNNQLLKSACFIDGKWIDKTESTFAVEDPFDGEVIARLPYCLEKETQSSIQSAHTALTSWKQTTAKHRAGLLMKWSELIKTNQKDLALIMTQEQGKPLQEAMGEVLYAASFVDWFAEESRRSYGDIIPANHPEQRIMVLKQPIGVVGIITPWNFPLAMITRKLAPALAAGCTAIIKPSEITPLSAIALCALAEKVGFPPGVINLVFGDASAIGKTLTGSTMVRKMSFTGSTRVGKILMEQSAVTVKKVSMELGGNAPFIVFEDADLDTAVEAAMVCKFRNTGQTCVCANRIYVQTGIYDSFLEKFKSRVGALKMGRGISAEVTQGPLINKSAKVKVEQHFQDALSRGARVVYGGELATEHITNGKENTFFTPTILEGVSHDALMCNEETFGPLVAISVFETEAEVIEKANDTEYGLAAYFCSKDLSRAWRVAEALEVGIVGINEGIISADNVPFGGVKQSGVGREGSKYGMDEYLEIKYVLVGIK